MGRARSGRWDDPVLLRALAAGWLDRGAARDPENELHVDADVICPRCLEWVAATDYVRRNAWGLAQHEVCPADIPGARRPS